MLDKFESLTLGPSAPGVHDNMDDAQSLPRPSGIIPGPPIQTYPKNAHHAFIRMTSIYAPRSGSLRERFQFPYGAIIQPLAEIPEMPPVPVVKLGIYGIVRCRRCRTYINPFVTWVDGGRRWQCNVCNCLNDTPRDYYCTLNDDGTRRDADSRPELACGSVEFVAPPEYMVISTGWAFSNLLPRFVHQCRLCISLWWMCRALRCRVKWLNHLLVRFRLRLTNCKGMTESELAS